MVDVAADAPLKPEGVRQLRGGGITPEVVFHLVEQAVQLFVGVRQSLPGFAQEGFARPLILTRWGVGYLLAEEEMEREP